MGYVDRTIGCVRWVSVGSRVGKSARESSRLTHSIPGKLGRSHRTPVPRKTSEGVLVQTVPQTDTGRWGENPKARERTLFKELGKIVP